MQGIIHVEDLRPARGVSVVPAVDGGGHAEVEVVVARREAQWPRGDSTGFRAVRELRLDEDGAIVVPPDDAVLAGRQEEAVDAGDRILVHRQRPSGEVVRQVDATVVVRRLRPCPAGLADAENAPPVGRNDHVVGGGQQADRRIEGGAVRRRRPRDGRHLLNAAHVRGEAALALPVAVGAVQPVNLRSLVLAGVLPVTVASEERPLKRDDVEHLGAHEIRIIEAGARHVGLIPAVDVVPAGVDGAVNGDLPDGDPLERRDRRRHDAEVPARTGDGVVPVLVVAVGVEPRRGDDVEPVLPVAGQLHGEGAREHALADPPIDDDPVQVVVRSEVNDEGDCGSPGALRAICDLVDLHHRGRVPQVHVREADPMVVELAGSGGGLGLGLCDQGHALMVHPRNRLHLHLLRDLQLGQHVLRFRLLRVVARLGAALCGAVLLRQIELVQAGLEAGLDELHCVADRCLSRVP
mmetsp:Transcript_84991/g.189908  ORF Transcript_84991/g.189908 Transcript_84991/m.189908 type:complete len:465 (-) Transcript_84991:225-1619(-)